MNIMPISSVSFNAKATVYDFVTNPTPEEVKTKKHLDAELAKKVPHDRKGRSIIEWVNARGLEVCYSRPYETHIVKGYRDENGKPVKIDESILVNEGVRPYLSRNISQFIENRPIEDAKNGIIQVDLTFRNDESKQEIKPPTTIGYLGDYDTCNTIEFDDVKIASKRLWKPYNICYGIMSAIGIGCIAGLCWLIPMTLKDKKPKTLPKTDTIELVQKALPQKIAKNTLMILGKKI